MTEHHDSFSYLRSDTAHDSLNKTMAFDFSENLELLVKSCLVKTLIYGGANGNLLTKLAQRTLSLTIKTIYEYDALNRIKSREYKTSTDAALSAEYATPRVDYYYDGTGLSSPPANSKRKLTKVSSAVSETRYTEFDSMGRVKQSEQVTDGKVYNFGYSYNLAGALESQRYPSGKIVRQEFDADGDLSKVTSQKGQMFRTLASSFSYTAAGAVSAMKLGNNRWESIVFNERLQPIQLALGTTENGTDLWKVNYSYGGSQNNGNVLSQTITVPTVGRRAFERPFICWFPNVDYRPF